MTPNPILKILATLASHQVRHLLMGGQACVLYGATEFSRNVDILAPASPPNLDRLREAIEELLAERVSAPPLEAEYLQRGHAVHFRCRRPEAAGVWIGVMSVLRGLDPWPRLWQRRLTLEDPAGPTLEVLSLPDLVQSKKTQRDRDWPTLRRLIEAHYLRHRSEPTPDRIEFWLRECRTPSILMELAAEYPQDADAMTALRPLLFSASMGNEEALGVGLAAEAQREQEADKAYWVPLCAEVEELRRGGR